jgi:iron complex transport system ATP-binding protein
MLKECKVACSGVPGDIITPENILSIYGVVAQVKIEQEKPYIIPLHKVKTGG